jgi:spoIIIJ-associated protein
MAQKQIKDLLTSLLKHLEINPQTINITKDENEAYQIQLELEEEDKGILIGYHGDTIAALQLVLSLLLYKQTAKWDRLIVNIGDYRQRRQESLEKMAQDTVQRVKFSSEPIALFNLNPFERRVIHMCLADHPDVVTASEGEGRHRHIIVSPSDSAGDKGEPPPLTDEPSS